MSQKGQKMQDIKKFAIKDMGEPRLKTMTMPSDTNPAGNIFGGWIMSQIDLAGSIVARELAPERAVTVAMDKVVFKEPVFVGDIICCYARILSVGTTSMVIQVEVIADRVDDDGLTFCVPVTSAILTFVSVDKKGHKKPIDAELKRIHGF